METHIIMAKGGGGDLEGNGDNDEHNALSAMYLAAHEAGLSLAFNKGIFPCPPQAQDSTSSVVYSLT